MRYAKPSITPIAMLLLVSVVGCTLPTTPLSDRTSAGGSERAKFTPTLSGLVWSKDGGEVYYATVDSPSVVFSGYRVSDGRALVIGRLALATNAIPRYGARGIDVLQLAVTRDGQLLYGAISLRLPGAPLSGSSGVDSVAIVRIRIADGNVATVHLASWPKGSMDGLATTSTGELAFVSERDSLFLLGSDGVTARGIAANCERVLGVSPSGDEVLCNSSHKPTFSVDVRTRAIHVRVPDGQEREASAWTDAGILFAVSSGNQLLTEMIGPDGRFVGAHIYAGASAITGTHPAVSADQRLAAADEIKCTPVHVDWFCIQATLTTRIFDLSSGKVVKMWEDTSIIGSLSRGRFAFSPDGNWVAKSNGELAVTSLH